MTLLRTVPMLFLFELSYIIHWSVAVHGQGLFVWVSDPHLSLRFILWLNLSTHADRSSISSIWACVHGFHWMHQKAVLQYVCCILYFNNYRSPCTIWVWSVWCETQQRLNVTLPEFRSSSLRVNRRGPVSPNVTSAVIHKAQSQSNIVQTCLSICMKDSIFVPQYEKPYAALGMLGMLGMLFFYFFIFFKELQQPHWKNLPLPTIYCSFHLKLTLVAVKHQQHFISFHTNYDYMGRLCECKCDSLVCLWSDLVHLYMNLSLTKIGLGFQFPSMICPWHSKKGRLMLKLIVI